MAPKRSDRPRTKPKTEAEMTPEELEEKRARVARLKSKVAGSIAGLASSQGLDNEAVRAAKEASSAAPIKRKAADFDEAVDEEAEKPVGKQRSTKEADGEESTKRKVAIIDNRDDDAEKKRTGKTKPAKDAARSGADNAEAEKPAKKTKTTKKSAKAVKYDQDNVADGAEPATEQAPKKKAVPNSSKAKTATGEPKKTATKTKAEPKPRKKSEPKDKVEKTKKAAPKKTKKSAAKADKAAIEAPAPALIPRITIQHGKNAVKYVNMLQRLEDKILDDGREPDEDRDIFNVVLNHFDDVAIQLRRVEKEGQRLADEAEAEKEREEAEKKQAAEEKGAAEAEAKRITEDKALAGKQLVEETQQAVEEKAAVDENQKHSRDTPAADITAPTEFGIDSLDADADDDEYEPAPAADQNEQVSREAKESPPTAELTNDTAAVEVKVPQHQDTAAVEAEENEHPAMPITDPLYSPTTPQEDVQSQEERFAGHARYRFDREEEQALSAFISTPPLPAPPLPPFSPEDTVAPAPEQSTGFTTPTKSVTDILGELKQHAVEHGTPSPAATAGGESGRNRRPVVRLS